MGRRKKEDIKKEVTKKIKSKPKITSKKKTYEMTLNEDGKKICPKCFQRDLSDVIDYGLSPENKKDKGVFMFKFVCNSCGCQLIDYCNM